MDNVPAKFPATSNEQAKSNGSSDRIQLTDSA